MGPDFLGRGGGIFTGANEPRMVPDLNFLGLGPVGGLLGNALMASPYGMQALGMMPSQFFPTQNLYDQYRAKEYFQQQMQASQMAAAADRSTYRQIATNLLGVFGPRTPETDRTADAMAGTASAFAPLVMQFMGPDWFDSAHGTRGSAQVMSQSLMRGGRFAVDPATGLTGLSGKTAGRMAETIHDRFFGPGADLSAFRGLSAGRVGMLYDQLQLQGLAGPSIAIHDRERQLDMLADEPLALDRLRRDRPEVYRAMLRRERAADPTLFAAGDADVERRVGGYDRAQRRDMMADLSRDAPGAFDDVRRDFDASRIGQRLRNLSGSVAAMRDIFGDSGKPNAPMAELVEGLNKLTQGGLATMSPQRLEQSVRLTQSLARSSGVGLDAMMGLMARGAGIADQLGLHREFAMHATHGAIAFGQAFGQSPASAVGNFNALSKDEMTLIDQRLRAQASGSGLANQTATTARYVDMMKRQGLGVGGDLASFMKAVESGEATFRDADGRERSVLMKQDEWRKMMLAGGADEALLNQMLNQKSTNQEYTAKHNIGDLVRAHGQGRDIERYMTQSFRGGIMAELGARGITGDRANRLAMQASAEASRTIMGMDSGDRRDDAKRERAVGDRIAALLSREGVAVSRGQAVGMASAGWGAFNEAVHRTAALSGYGTNLGAVEAVDPRILARQAAVRQENVIAGNVRSVLADLGQAGPLARISDLMQESPKGLGDAIGRLLGGFSPGNLKTRLRHLRDASPEDLRRMGITDRDKVAAMTEQLVLTAQQYDKEAHAEAKTPADVAARERRLKDLHGDMDAISKGGDVARKRLEEVLKAGGHGYSSAFEALAGKGTAAEKDRIQALALAAKGGLTASATALAAADAGKPFDGAAADAKKKLDGDTEKRDDPNRPREQRITGTLVIEGLDKAVLQAKTDFGGGHGSTPVMAHA